ncbi:hypothetical protein ACXWR7_13180, partial [Streptococcus pyogenes]
QPYYAFSLPCASFPAPFPPSFLFSFLSLPFFSPPPSLFSPLLPFFPFFFFSFFFLLPLFPFSLSFFFFSFFFFFFFF